MLNYIWGIIIVLSIVASVFTGNTSQLANGTIEGANDGLSLILTMLPMLVLWSGIMEIAQKSGATEIIAKVFHPVLKRFFPDLEAGSPALKCISLNISANLLGLGNAATPFGLRAMEELKKLDPENDTASDSMIVFVVMNTASIQLLPTTIAALRYSNGSTTPFDILPCVWVSSVTALAVGLTIAKLFNAGNRLKTSRSGR